MNYRLAFSVAVHCELTVVGLSLCAPSELGTRELE